MLLVFAGSGAAALIYEIVWFELLHLAVGSSAVSLAVVLAAFMGGLCIGSLALPIWLPTRIHPFRLCAALEIGIGVCGLALLWIIPALGHAYAALGGGVAERATLAVVALVPPTMLMGGTLPIAARAASSSASGLAWLTRCYAANLIGAVVGTVAAGFYLLRLFDVAVATATAAAINVAVAMISLRLAKVLPHADRSAPLRLGKTLVRAASHAPPLHRTPIYVALALSGMAALACEVIWTRLLGLVFGATVYAFSLILALFLVGLGVGSAIGSALVRRTSSSRLWFAIAQALLCGAVALAAFSAVRLLPAWPIAEDVNGDIWRTLAVDALRCALVLLPPTLLWGASFPLALAALGESGGAADPSRLLGRAYAANTLGAIAGALTASLIVVPQVGSQRGQQYAIAASALSALTILVPGRLAGARLLGRSIASIVVVGLAGWLAAIVPAVPDALIAYGRRAAEWEGLTTVVYAAEGPTTAVAVTRAANGVLSYHAAGKVQASVQPEDMRLQRMLGHLSHLIASKNAEVLVIGCGAGITAGALSIAPDIARLTIAEIEPTVPPIAARYFGQFNEAVLSNPRTRLRIDDGRHVLFTSSERYDVITTDMVDPWVKGVAALFTEEFFQAAKRRLEPGGVVTQFVQLYQSSPEAVKSEIATFARVFPHTAIFANTNNGQGYDLVLVGQAAPMRIDVDALRQRLDSPAYGGVARSLREVGFDSVPDLLATYAMSASDLRPWLEHAGINRDRNLRLQYLAGLGLNRDESAAIYKQMQEYAQFPVDLFAGSPAGVQAVREAIAKRKSP